MRGYDIQICSQDAGSQSQISLLQLWIILSNSYWRPSVCGFHWVILKDNYWVTCYIHAVPVTPDTAFLKASLNSELLCLPEGNVHIVFWSILSFIFFIAFLYCGAGLILSCYSQKKAKNTYLTIKDVCIQLTLQMYIPYITPHKSSLLVTE